MSEKAFATPQSVKLAGHDVIVDSAATASEILMSVDWPTRGPAHETASDICLKVLDGHRSTAEAEQAFTAAAREAGILLDR